jgi:hypothetical protein
MTLFFQKKEKTNENSFVCFLYQGKGKAFAYTGLLN